MSDLGDRMMRAPEQVFKFQFIGGRLCLDFANTLSGTRARPREKLSSYQDLVAWGRQARVLTETEADHLADEGLRRPEDAARTLEHAIEIREAIFRIFSSIVGDEMPDHADLAALNDALSRALAHLRVSKPATGFVWEWAPDRKALDRMLWPVVQSAADVLHSGEVARVGRCGGKDCDWLFLDMSRNHSRRWCDMRDCGNRAKARRHYARVKAQR